MNDLDTPGLQEFGDWYEILVRRDEHGNIIVIDQARLIMSVAMRTSTPFSSVPLMSAPQVVHLATCL